MIDQTCRARLADFGLLTVVSDSVNLFSSSTTQTHGGTLRWMSPELIAPEKFGFETNRPTRSSDCYSLGMVAYETFSGKIPFHETPDRAVFLKVVEGKSPSRGVGFTDDLWKMMEQCWMSHPDHRPNVEDVLQYFEMCSMGGNLSFDSLISTSAGNPDNLDVWDTLDNHPMDSVSWFSLCPASRLIIPHLCRSSSPYGIEHGNWFAERLTRSSSDPTTEPAKSHTAHTHPHRREEAQVPIPWLPQQVLSSGYPTSTASVAISPPQSPRFAHCRCTVIEFIYLQVPAVPATRF